MRKIINIYAYFFDIFLYHLTLLDKKYLTLFLNSVIMDNDHVMKNERCLIKKIIEIKEKIVKTFIIFVGLTFLMGFYYERNIYVIL